jgi:hypothetical protein
MGRKNSFNTNYRLSWEGPKKKITTKSSKK